MAITLESNTNTPTSVTTSTFTLLMPSTRPDGDLYVAIVVKDDFLVFTTDLEDYGWTELYDDYIINDVRVGVWYRIGDSEPASYDLVGDYEQWAGNVMRFSGVDPSSPINAWDYDTGSGVPEFPAVTPTVPGGFLLRLFGIDSDGPVSSSTPSGHTWINGGKGYDSIGAWAAYAAIYLSTTPTSGIEVPSASWADVDDSWAAFSIVLNPTTGVYIGAPIVDTPTIGQSHVLTGVDIAAGAAAVDSPTVDAAAHVLIGQDVLSGEPTIDSATIGQIHGLAGDAVSAGMAVIDPAVISQIHALLAIDLVSSDPTIASPAACQSFITAGKSLVYRYYATLTGAPDGLSDYPLSMKTVQFRNRDADPSYIGVSLAYSAETATAIAARPNGELVIEMSVLWNGTEVIREELSRADLYSMRYDRGASNASISLTAYASRGYTEKIVQLDAVQTETMLPDGRIQFRCARPDFYLRPGDTVLYGAHSILVGSVSCLITPVLTYMDVQEAGA